MKVKNDIDVCFTELNFEALGNADTGKEEYKAPTRFMILPASPIVGRNNRNYHFDADEVLLNFEAEKLEIPVDINHATEIKAPQGEPAPAMAWVPNLEKEVDGSIWVNNTEWNNEYPLKWKDYKYVSPAVKTDITGKIKRITSIGLVNKPNFDLPALNSEDSEEPSNNIGGEMDKDMLKALGLNENASKDAVIQAIHDLKDKPTNLNNKELEDKVTELNLEISSLKVDRFNEKKERVVEDAIKQGKIMPSSKEVFITSLNSEDSLQKFSEAMEKAPSILGASIKKPNAKEEVSLNSEDAKIAEKYGLNSEEFKNKKEELFG